MLYVSNICINGDSCSISITDTDDNVTDVFSADYINENWKVLKPLKIHGLSWTSKDNGKSYKLYLQGMNHWGIPKLMKPSELYSFLDSIGVKDKLSFFTKVCSIERQIDKGSSNNISILSENWNNAFWSDTNLRHAVLHYFKSAGLNVVRVPEKVRPDGRLSSYAYWVIKI